MATLPSTDYPDFQPSAAYNQVVVNQTFNSLGSSGTLINETVVSYQSLRVIAHAPSNGMTIGIVYTASLGGVGITGIRLIDINPGDFVDVTVPCDGPFVSFQYQNVTGASQNATLVVFGITRPTLAPVYLEYDTAPGNLGENIPPSSTLTFWMVGTMAGDAYFYFNPYSGTTQLICQVIAHRLAAGGDIVLFQQTLSANIVTMNLLLPPNPVNVTVINRDPTNFQQFDWALIRKGS